MQDNTSLFDLWRGRIALLTGPIVFLIVLFFPTGLQPIQQRVLAIIIFVFVWWFGEAVPLPVTALLVPVLGILLGIETPKRAFAPFANEIIFLFLGSFIIARAITLHGLDRRFAYFLLSRKSLKGRGVTSIFVLGVCAWLLSMWLSNTATTAMLMPLCYGLLREIERNGSKLIAGGLILIAFATSAGGIATPVGTPPNLVGIGMLRELAGIRISFAGWMALSILPSLIMFLLIFFVIYLFHFKRSTGGSFSFQEKESTGRFTPGEINTLIAFSVTAILWILPGIVSPFLKDGALKIFLTSVLDESVVALIGAVLLFVLPVDLKKGEWTITWKEAVKIDWGTILLFGGGLSLGGMIMSSGLADVLGKKVLQTTGGNEILVTFLVVALSVGITEMISNTATANMLIPLVIGVAKAGGFSPFLPVYGACLGASMAFLLPISTPPNSIVYGTGKIPLMQMVRVGFILDCMSIIVINLWILLLRFIQPF